MLRRLDARQRMWQRSRAEERQRTNATLSVGLVTADGPGLLRLVLDDRLCTQRRREKAPSDQTYREPEHKWPEQWWATHHRGRCFPTERSYGWELFESRFCPAPVVGRDGAPAPAGDA